MTPERLDSRDHELLNNVIEESLAHPNWIEISVLNTLRRALDVTRLKYWADDELLAVCQRPAFAIQCQIRWHPAIAGTGTGWMLGELEHLNTRLYRDRSEVVDSIFTYADWYSRFCALRALTNGSITLLSDGRSYQLLSDDAVSSIAETRAFERDAKIDVLFRPAFIGGLIGSGSNTDMSLNVAAAQIPNRWTVSLRSGDTEVSASVFASIAPLVCDDDQRIAYFPLHVVVNLPEHQLRGQGQWHPEPLRRLWANLQSRVDQRLEQLGERVPKHRPALEIDDLTTFRLVTPAHPRWDDDRRSLYVGKYLIKQFTQAAENQVTLLKTFQESEWPSRIDDPIPPTAGIDAKDRLREAVKALNTHHKTPRLISFHMDGTGQGVTFDLHD